MQHYDFLRFGMLFGLVAILNSTASAGSSAQNPSSNVTKATISQLDATTRFQSAQAQQIEERLKWPPFIRFISDNPLALLALLTAVTGIWRYFGDRRSSRQQERNTQVFEALRRFSDPQSSASRASGALLLGLLGTPTAKEQLLLLKAGGKLHGSLDLPPLPTTPFFRALIQKRRLTQAANARGRLLESNAVQIIRQLVLGLRIEDDPRAGFAIEDSLDALLESGWSSVIEDRLISVKPDQFERLKNIITVLHPTDEFSIGYAPSSEYPESSDDFFVVTREEQRKGLAKLWSLDEDLDNMGGFVAIPSTHNYSATVSYRDLGAARAVLHALGWHTDKLFLFLRQRFLVEYAAFVRSRLARLNDSELMSLQTRALDALMMDGNRCRVRRDVLNDVARLFDIAQTAQEHRNWKERREKDWEDEWQPERFSRMLPGA